MSVNESPRPGLSPMDIVLIIGIVLVLGFTAVTVGRIVMARMGSGPVAVAASSRAEGFPRELRQILDSRGGSDETLGALKTHFPEDYARLSQQMIAAAGDGITEAELWPIFAGAMGELTVRHKSAFAHAPATLIAQTSRAEMQLLESIRSESLDRCGEIAAQTEFNPNNVNLNLQTSNRTGRLADKAMAARLNATATGLKSPVATHVMSVEDQQALVSGVQVQSSNPRIAQMLLSGQIAQGSPTEKCEAALLFYRVLSRMPDETAGRITGSMLARL